MQSVDDALGVDVDLLQMLRDVDVLETTSEEDARVVDHHVEPTGRLGEFAYPLRHFGGIGDIKMPDNRGSAKLVDLISQRLQTDLVDVVAADGIALLCEGQGGGPADPRGGAGDEHGSVVGHHAMIAHEAHFMVARLCQRLRRLSVPPNNVVKWVESMSTMSPAR